MHGLPATDLLPHVDYSNASIHFQEPLNSTQICSGSRAYPGTLGVSWEYTWNIICTHTHTHTNRHLLIFREKLENIEETNRDEKENMGNMRSWN